MNEEHCLIDNSSNIVSVIWCRNIFKRGTTAAWAAATGMQAWTTQIPAICPCSPLKTIQRVHAHKQVERSSESLVGNGADFPGNGADFSGYWLGASYIL